MTKHETIEHYTAFTLVFEGDARKFPNPFTTESPWGKPRAACVWDALAETDMLREALAVDVPKDPPIERYIVRGAGPHRGEWAFIYLDEEKGTFTCYSSYGSFNYCWYSIGTATLKEFLTGLNRGYFMQKCRGRDYMQFDFDETIKSIRKQIQEWRADGRLDSDKARDCWDEVREMERTNSADVFCERFWSCSALSRAYNGDYEGIICESIDPQCREFWKVIWPEFLKQIAPDQLVTTAPTEEATT
jgi:hypothetical protein